MNERVLGSGARLQVLPGAAELARAAADVVQRSIAAAITARGQAVVALAGGSTPRAAYQELSSRRVAWERVTFILGDERLVPPDHQDSNLAMCRAALGSQARIEAPVPAGWSPETGAGAGSLAREYAGRIAEMAPPAAAAGVPCLDLVLLGLGADGHVASLFPGSPALAERRLWVVAAPGPGAGTGSPEVARLTLSPPILAGGRGLLFLVCGRGKAAVLARVLAAWDEVAAPGGSPGSDELPAARLAAAGGRASWLVDREAAAGFSRRDAEACGPDRGRSSR